MFTRRVNDSVHACMFVCKYVFFQWILTRVLFFWLNLTIEITKSIYLFIYSFLQKILIYCWIVISWLNGDEARDFHAKAKTNLDHSSYYACHPSAEAVPIFFILF